MRTGTLILIVWTAAAWPAQAGADGSVPTSDEIKPPTEIAAPADGTSPGEAKASRDGPAAEQSETEAAGNADFKAPSGYTTKTKGDKTYYCRRETPTGTRFPTDYCYTQEQLQRILKSGQSIRDDVAKRQRTCSGSSCMGE